MMEATEQLIDENLAKNQLVTQQNELLEERKKQIELQYVLFQKKIEQLNIEIDEIYQKIDLKKKEINNKRENEKIMTFFIIIILLCVLSFGLRVY